MTTVTKVVACAVLSALLVANAPGADRAEMAGVLAEAESLFRQANECVSARPDEARELYAKAVMRYERVVREGRVENGGLYYNIGNAYFRMGDIGRAILNYRRAEQYIPNDPNLRQNLTYARSRRADKIEEQQKTRVLKTLFFWHYDVPARARGIIFGACFALAWGFAMLRVFVKRSFTAWGLGVCAVFSLMFFGSLLVETVGDMTHRPGVVTSPEVVARKGDGESFEPSFKEPLHAGTEFVLIENRGKWYNIELADCRQCWVPAGGVELLRPAR